MRIVIIDIDGTLSNCNAITYIMDSDEAAEPDAKLIASAPTLKADNERLRAENEGLRGVLSEWLPIAQRQLDGLLRIAEAVNQGKAVFESAAFKAATERVERMRVVLAKPALGEDAE